MRDIQEIMKEVDNLNDEIAVTCAVACSGTGGEFACATETNRNIPFSCTLTMPQGFRFDHLLGAEAINNPRIAYNLDCLTAFVEPCFCAAATGNSLRYAIRVVGCISYIVNLRVLNDSSTDICVAANNQEGTPEIFVCCHDSVCVDTTVCFACIEQQAFTQLGIIRNRLATCGTSGVDISSPLITANCVVNGTVVAVTVSGNFILPDCSTVV